MPTMPKQSPVEYAERTLGAHDAYQSAGKAAEKMNEALDKRNSASIAIRDMTEALAQAEADLTDSERAANPDMSATAFKEHMKGALQKDPDMKDLRHGLAQARAAYESADASVKQFTTRVEIETARMNELGGYFHYLAAAKNAATRSRTASTASTANGDKT